MMETLETTMAINELAIYTYFLVGLLFIFFSIIILTLGNIVRGLRLGLSFFFLAIGFYFFNSAGKILNNYTVGFMKLSIINSIIITILALFLVVVVSRLNSEKKNNPDN